MNCNCEQDVLNSIKEYHKDSDDIFICSECKHEFYGKDVGITKKTDNCDIMFALEYKGYYFSCPNCNYIAFLGFDVKE